MHMRKGRSLTWNLASPVGFLQYSRSPHDYELPRAKENRLLVKFAKLRAVFHVQY